MRVIKILAYNKNLKNYQKYYYQQIIYMSWFKVMNRDLYKRLKKTIIIKIQQIKQKKRKNLISIIKMKMMKLETLIDI